MSELTGTVDRSSSSREDDDDPGPAPELSLIGVEPAGGSTIADPRTTPTLRVRFGVRSSGVTADTHRVSIIGGATVDATVQSGKWQADLPVPPLWPTLTVAVDVAGRVVRRGELPEKISATATVTLHVQDASAPEIRSAEGSATDSGTGFDLQVRARVFDHTSGLAHMEWSLNGGAVTRDTLGDAPRVEQTWARTIFTTVIGDNRVHLRVVDRAGRAAEQVVTVRTADTTPPTAVITSPSDNQAFVAGATGVEITVTGTAADAQSGMSGGQA